MLKIRDEVDLKELEKFGFEEMPFSFENGPVSVCKHDKEVIIEVGCEGCYVIQVENIDILFDLIQAGLVEKEAENE